MAKLYFYYGAMGSSKTANALMTRFNYEEVGQKALLCRPKIDDRYSKDEIVSHNNSRVKTVVVSTANDIYDYLDKQEKLPYAIAIDEIQFFSQSNTVITVIFRIIS